MIPAARYISQMIIPEIGLKGQEKIAAAKILVIGAGGLGCPVLSYLAAMGTGTIGIVDNDIVEMKNLHRQVLYNEIDIGNIKAEVAKQKLQVQNSGITIVAYPERFTERNAATIISGYDIIIDCCDNVETRYITDTITKNTGKPFIYGAVRQFEGQVSVFNYKNGPCFAQLFPDKAKAAAEADCSSAGIIGFVTGIIGCLQANEALKIILNDATVLSGEILTMDLSTLCFKKFKIL